MNRLIINFFINIIFLLSLITFFFINKFVFNYNSLYTLYSFDWFNIKYFFAIDSISIFFVLLCGFILSICLILNWYLVYNLNLFLFSIFLSMFCLINIFFTMDMFILFIFFELIVLPLFIIVGIWGSRERRIYAAYQLFIFTLFGSAFALFVFIYIYTILGTSNYMYLYYSFFIDSNIKILLFFFLFIGFSVKVPIIPLHMWLPEAHVEAPTVGSVILAGIVLKLSFYIYFRLLIFPFIEILNCVIDVIFVIAIISILLSSFFSIAQIDMKKIIAYSSISHMNYSLIGLFSGNVIAVLGSIFMMFGHAIVSSALFMSIGSIYDRYKTRILFYYSGLVLIMPIFVSMFFIFVLANFAVPGTINFVGEFVIFLGVFYVNNFIIFFTIFGMFLTTLYSLFLYNRVSTGVLKVNFISFFCDLSRRESYLYFALCFFIVLFGLYPNPFFDYVFASIFI